MNRDEVLSVLNRQQTQDGVRRYTEIMDMFHRVNVAQNAEFQTAYNYFYKVRQRNQQWYESYFAFMEKHKRNKAPTFEETLRYMFEHTGKVEASFSSKLVHTINPELPILDSKVLKNTGIKYPSSANKETRLKKRIATYNQLTDWYSTYLPTAEATTLIACFDEVYPNNNISALKKVDFVLWQMRE